MRYFFLLITCFHVPVATSESVLPALERAQRVYGHGRLQEAQATLHRAWREGEAGEEREEVERLLGLWNLEILFSKNAQRESVFHEVVIGDSLGKLAKTHGTTEELICRINELRTSTIQLGQRLKIPCKPFRAEVDKSENSMVVYFDGRFFKRYRVATGANNHTPCGDWRIVSKVEHPDWTRPSDGVLIPYGHPDHRIGSHWLGWDRAGFGIHGTIEPETLGTQASSGCVRMHNESVAEVFLLFPRGTRVLVRN